jgi:CheY-like chemotaxis protein
MLPASACILCVDEDPKVVALRGTLLSIAGYEVVTATNVEGALRLLREHRINLVITEHLQPDSEFEEFIGAVKQHRRDVPILLYTALSEPPEGIGQVDRILAKGMNPADFLSEVASLVVKARSQSAGSGS